MTRAVAAPRHAIVLAAGLGTRLRPLTDVRAKAAIPIGREPIVRRIAGWLAAQGVSDIVVNLHHLPSTITAVLGDGSDLAVRVRYSWEQPEVLGSGGGPARAWPILGHDYCFIVNGDTMTDLDLRAFWDAHAAGRSLVTLALVENTEPQRYGGVQLDRDQRVVGFVRRGPAAEGSYHFIGIQAASAEAFRGVAPDRPSASIGGFYDRLLTERPGSIRGFVAQAAFWDVGTPADYLRTCAALAPGASERTGRRVRIDATARLTSAIVWDDVEVGAECRLENCIVTDRVRVPAGAEYRDAILVARPDGSLATTPIPR